MSRCKKDCRFHFDHDYPLLPGTIGRLRAAQNANLNFKLLIVDC